MLRNCERPGCHTLTLGSLCAQHEPPVRGSFRRGRPFRTEEPERAGNFTNTLGETKSATKALDKPD